MFSHALVLVACVLCSTVHAFVPQAPPLRVGGTICAASKDLSVARREFVETCVIAAGAVAAAAPAAFAAPVADSLTEYSDPRYGFQFSVPSAWNKVSDTVKQCVRALCITTVSYLSAQIAGPDSSDRTSHCSLIVLLFDSCIRQKQRSAVVESFSYGRYRLLKERLLLLQTLSLQVMCCCRSVAWICCITA
jgi:hypothetical protein